MLSSTTDFYVSCHCQANLLKLSIPATPKQLEPTLADADANSGTLADGASTDDDGWTEVSSASAWPEPEAAESVAGGAAEIDGKDAVDSDAENETETAYAAAAQALATSAPLIVCDCSICVKRLIIWSVQPTDRITLIRGCEKGRGTMKSYSFGKKTWDHCFCGTCGTHVFSAKQGDTQELGINLRAVRQPLIDIYSLNPHQSHAASLAPAYQEAVLPEQTSAYLEARQKLYDFPTTVYTASCHCQAVVFGVVAKDLDEEEPFACMCSICAGNGNIWLPIGKYDLAFSNPSPSSSASNPCKPNHNLVTFYRFGPSRVNHVFCNTCGCQLYETIDGGDDDASFEGKRGERVDEMWTKVNVAAFEGAGRLLGDGTGKGWGKVKVKRQMIELGAKYEIRL